MLIALVIFVWSLVLFPSTADTNLNFVRPNNNWTDSMLLAAIAESGFSIGFLAYFHLATVLFPATFYLIVAAIIYTRHSTDWFSLYLSVLFVIFGTVSSSLARQIGNLHPVLGLIVSGLGNGGWIGLFPVFYLFPDGKFVPRWAWIMLVLWGGMVLLLFAGGPSGKIDDLLNAVAIAIAMSIFIVGAVSQVYRYFRYSNAIQRQQTKWVLAAFLFFVLSVVFSLGNLALTPPGHPFSADDLINSLWVSVLFAISGAALPISIGIAILRYRLWDIDLIIRRSLIYSVLTALLVFVYFGGVIVLQQLFHSLTGAGDDLAIILSTLAIAGLFNPLRRRIQEVIDRRFFRRKYDAQQVLAQFAETARDETDLEKLKARLIGVVNETMQPAQVTLWMREPGPRGEDH